MHKEMALRGKGVAWLPDHLIMDELRSGELVALDPESLNIPFQIRLYRNNGLLHVDAETLWERMEQQCQQGHQFI